MYSQCAEQKYDGQLELSDPGQMQSPHQRKWQSKYNEVRDDRHTSNGEYCSLVVDTFGLDCRIPCALDWMTRENNEENVGGREGDDKDTNSPYDSVESTVWENPTVKEQNG